MLVNNQEMYILGGTVILIYIMYCIRKSKLTIVEASNTGMKVQVYNGKNKLQSADLLSEIIQRMFKLRNYLIENKDKYPDHKEYIILLEKNLNEDRTQIYENDPNSDLTSFSVNKGEEVAFCLKSKKTG